MRIVTVLLAAALAGPALAADKVDPARVEEAIRSAFPGADADWKQRLVQDETMKVCTANENAPTGALFEEIQKRERATIQYPPDGQLMGEWKKGEALAQSGYGLRFTDYPQRREIGGNCYACHQLTPQEVSYGTVGPSLLGYGKARQGPDDAKAVYDKIYNPHATFPCSLMPRFGHNKVLTPDQIKHLVALLLDLQSPVNK
ncbi:MAG TPA: sulfur oxidation c-type cytochrome SoxX [Beijerinckiaceae bacterium]|nr:sulfur oxidation c-type cytochrome SoxX [Beijerinckiaceae bacterium]